MRSLRARGFRSSARDRLGPRRRRFRRSRRRGQRSSARPIARRLRRDGRSARRQVFPCSRFLSAKEKFAVPIAAFDRRRAKALEGQPSPSTCCATRAQTSLCTKTSRTTPFFTAARPASNCGLISAINVASGAPIFQSGAIGGRAAKRQHVRQDQRQRNKAGVADDQTLAAPRDAPAPARGRRAAPAP